MISESVLLGGIVFLALVCIGLFVYIRHFKNVTNSKIDSLHRAIKKSDTGERMDGFQETLDNIQKQVNLYIVEKNNETKAQERDFARTRFLGRNVHGQPQGAANQQGGQPPRQQGSFNQFQQPHAQGHAMNGQGQQGSFMNSFRQQQSQGQQGFGSPQQPQQQGGQQQQNNRMPYGGFGNNR